MNGKENRALAFKPNNKHITPINYRSVSDRYDKLRPQVSRRMWHYTNNRLLIIPSQSKVVKVKCTKSPSKSIPSQTRYSTCCTNQVRTDVLVGGEWSTNRLSSRCLEDTFKHNDYIGGVMRNSKMYRNAKGHYIDVCPANCFKHYWNIIKRWFK